METGLVKRRNAEQQLRPVGTAAMNYPKLAKGCRSEAATREGRLVSWSNDQSHSIVQDYGRTGSLKVASDHISSAGEQPHECNQWSESPFFHLLQIGESLLRRLTAESEAEFPVLQNSRAVPLTKRAE